MPLQRVMTMTALWCQSNWEQKAVSWSKIRTRQFDYYCLLLDLGVLRYLT